MDNKQLFVWILAIMSLLIVMLTPVACTMQRDQIIGNAIEKGADPIATRCALDRSAAANDIMCLAKSIQQTNSVKQP